MTLKEIKKLTSSLKIWHGNIDALLELVESIPMTAAQRHAVDIFVEAAIDSRIAGDLMEDVVFKGKTGGKDKEKAVGWFLPDTDDARRYMLSSYDGTLCYSFCKGYKTDDELNEGQEESEDVVDEEDNLSQRLSMYDKVRLFKRLDAATAGDKIEEEI